MPVKDSATKYRIVLKIVLRITKNIYEDKIKAFNIESLKFHPFL